MIVDNDDGTFSIKAPCSFDRTKPVGYFTKDSDGWWAETDKKSGIPLYTAPREFSDEEILEYAEVFALDYSPLYEFTAQGLILFVRAILKEASEK